MSMKKCVATMIAGVTALTIAGSASAQTITLRLTGSTAYRNQTHNAILHILDAGYTFGYAGSAATISGASQAVFKGTVNAGAIPVIIQTSWSGSVGGVQNLTENLTIANWLTATNLSGGTGANNLSIHDSAVTADMAMSDSFQGATAFTTPALVDQVVGVAPFTWVRGAGSPSNMVNMTTLLAQTVLAGQTPLSQWTANPADASVNVSVVGRDEDSGTRLCAFAETAFGIFGAPFQYQPTGTLGASGLITAMNAWPVNTVNGTTYDVGHSGYSSGGTLASAVGTPVGAGLGFVVAYLSTGDGATATNMATGATFMNWNGFPYSLAAVQNGQYTFWVYEHLMYRSSLGGNQKVVADKIAKQIHDTDAAVLLSGMNVGRQSEGAVVTAGSPY